MLFFFLTLSFLCFLIQPLKACSSPHPAESILREWKKICHHPLCGKIYQSRGRSYREGITTSAEQPSDCNLLSEDLQKIQKTVSSGSVLLLGEVHDNAEHHKFRATFVRPPVVVMEQFTLEQQTALNSFNQLSGTLSKKERMPVFEKSVKWEKSPWSGYDYKTLFEAIFDTQTLIRAGDPPFASVRKTAKYGAAALTTLDLERLALLESFEQNVMDDLKTDIKEAHCGMLPDAILGNMAFAQRYRDAVLADSTLDAVNIYGSAIVLAGNEHVRRDRGIPWYLKKRISSLFLVSVMLKEVEVGKTQAEEYNLLGPDDHPIADYIVFTPETKRENPCNSFGKKIDQGK